MKRMTELASKLDNAIDIDDKGNIENKKDLKIDGNLKFKSLVSDSNPDGVFDPSSGGTGGGETELGTFDVISVSDKKYTGELTGKQILLKQSAGGAITYRIPFLQQKDTISNGSTRMTCYFKDNSPRIHRWSLLDGEISTGLESDYYVHFITLTKGTESIYLQLTNSKKNQMNISQLKSELSGKKTICTAVLDTSVNALYVTNEASTLNIYYGIVTEAGKEISHKSVSDFAMSDLVTPQW